MSPLLDPFSLELPAGDQISALPARFTILSIRNTHPILLTCLLTSSIFAFFLTPHCSFSVADKEIFIHFIISQKGMTFVCPWLNGIRAINDFFKDCNPVLRHFICKTPPICTLPLQPLYDVDLNCPFNT